MYETSGESIEHVRVIRLPTIGVKRYSSQERKSPISYFSPIKQFGVSSHQTSPRIREVSLSPGRYERLMELDKSVKLLHDYSVLLKQSEDIQQDNLSRIISYNKGERQSSRLNVQNIRNSQVSNRIQKRQKEIIDKLNERDPFIIRDLRQRIVNKTSALDRIVKQHENYKERMKDLVLKIQNHKYQQFWMKRDQIGPTKETAAQPREEFQIVHPTQQKHTFGLKKYVYPPDQ